MTEKDKIKAIMNEKGVDEETAGEILAVRDGFSDDDGTKFTYDEKKGCFTGTDPQGRTIYANM